MLQCVAMRANDMPYQWHELQCVALCCTVLHCVALCCTVLQFVAVCCCSELQCVALVKSYNSPLRATWLVQAELVTSRIENESCHTQIKSYCAHHMCKMTYSNHGESCRTSRMSHVTQKSNNTMRTMCATWLILKRTRLVAHVEWGMSHRSHVAHLDWVMWHA